MNADVRKLHLSMKIHVDNIKALKTERYKEIHNENMIRFDFPTKLFINSDDITNEKYNPHNHDE